MREGIKFAALPTLIELKLASGMTSPDRLKDLTDVQELIKLFALPVDFSADLSEYVRPKFAELWEATRQAKKRFVYLWRNTQVTAKAKTIDELIEALQGGAPELEEMRPRGRLVIADPDGTTRDDYSILVTTDPDVARRFSMHEESEYWGARRARRATDDQPPAADGPEILPPLT